MRVLRITVILFFIMSCICFGLFCGIEWKNKDRNAPAITLESDALKVSVSASEQKLLEGVTAVDAEDGDLTAFVQIASLSPLIGDNERTIRYIVFDKADQMAMAERTLIYTDYEPPRIYLKEPLRFSPNNISAKMEQLDVAATDVIDGDLTNRMRISYDIYDKIPSGEYEVVLQVNNSAGDTCIVPLKATVLDLAEENGKIYPALSDYIVYTQIGQELEAEAFLLGVTSGDLAYPFGEEEGEITVQDIQIRSEVNYEKEGVYTMDYSYTSPEDITATTTLYVVVEEK